MTGPTRFGRVAPALVVRLEQLTPPPFRVRVALSVTGYLMTAGIVAFIALNFPGFGHDTAIWDRAGDQVRAGISPYQQPDVDRDLLFLYSPVWAVIWASVSWLPREAVIVGLMLLEILALRYCARSWLRVGYFALIPLVGFELSVGQINLVIAAAVAAALRGDGRLAVVAAFAKLSPILAVRDVKGPLIVAMLCVAVTIPILPLWGEWFQMLANATAALGPAPFPYVGRLAIALALLALRRRWATGLAVIVAIPNVTPNVYVLLAALMPAATRTPARAPDAGPAPELQPA